MNEFMLIRPVQRSDAAAWERMRQSLWPSSPGEHAAEIASFFEGKLKRPAEVLIALNADEQAIGFAELAIRDYAEGCYPGRVTYLEGWYVEPFARRQSVGARSSKPRRIGAVRKVAQSSRPIPAWKIMSVRRRIAHLVL
jgi:aminoglycoside 6'-N-acetyltransferase I